MMNNCGWKSQSDFLFISNVKHLFLNFSLYIIHFSLFIDFIFLMKSLYKDCIIWMPLIKWIINNEWWIIVVENRKAIFFLFQMWNICSSIFHFSLFTFHYSLISSFWWNLFIFTLNQGQKTSSIYKSILSHSPLFFKYKEYFIVHQNVLHIIADKKLRLL